MQKLRTATLAVLPYFLLAILSRHGEELTSSCLRAYEQGGAAAVVQSPECSKLLADLTDSSSVNQSDKYCLLGTGILPDKHQESRMFCDLRMNIPFHGEDGLKDIKVGMVAMFDAHIGEEASKMAAELLKKYFLVHTYILRDGTYATNKLRDTLPSNDEQPLGFQLLNELEQLHLKLNRTHWSLPNLLNDKTHVEILKEAFSRTMHDMDLTFSEVLLKSTHVAGCIATVVLMVKGRMLVVNGCNSKSLLCSGKIWRHLGDLQDEGLWVDLSAENSSANYHRHPQSYDRPAQFKLVDDIHLSRYDSMITPEMMDWYNLKGDESRLVVASAVIFERLPRREICNLASGTQLLTTYRKSILRSCNFPPSGPNCVADSAYWKGKTEGTADNDILSVAVVPLAHTGFRASQRSDAYQAQRCKEDPVLCELSTYVS